MKYDAQEDNKTPQINGRIDLPTPESNGLGADTQLLRGATPLNENEISELVPIDEVCSDYNIEEISSEASSARGGRTWLWLLMGVLGLSVAELVLFIRELFTESDLLGGLWLLVLTVFVFLTGQQLVTEWRGLRRLKQRDKFAQQATQLLESPTIGQAMPVCKAIAERLPASSKQGFSVWHTQLNDSYNDKEVLALFEQEVITPLDKASLALVTSNATASSVMIAVSPFALLDMLIVLWRNLKMMRQISKTYGMELSYWGRIQLLRNVFKTMLYAGASEILADAGNYALGTGITGKLSTRIAQGMGAGILTTRIGLKTIQACRPIPYINAPKPGLTDVSHQVLEAVKNKLHRG